MTSDTYQFNIEKIRNEFPSIDQEIHGKQLVYLDSAATSLKPTAVIDCINEFYGKGYSTVRRGVYQLSEKATLKFEETRSSVARFIGAATEKEIIFTSGTTESINLLASSFGRKFLSKGDEVIISAIEHHANIVPWQLICEEKEAVLKIIPVDEKGDLIQEEYRKLLNEKTKLVAVGHVSNALGTVNPIKEMIAEAHKYDIPVLIDGAQACSHMAVDVQDLDCDFYAFSGHKIYGPTGVGVLYGKMKYLEEMPPYQSGGDMIMTVSFEKSVFQKPPQRFEAGTPPIVEVIGLGAAIEYLQKVGLDNIAAYENELLQYATKTLSAVDGLRIIGQAKKKAGVLSFYLEDAHPHDIGTILDGEGIAIRAGHHCSMPTMKRYCVPATARASFGIYNTKEDIDILVKGINKVLEIFK